jgi:RHS repeat-associated protein
VTSAVDLFAYDPSVSASLSPTAGQTPTGTYAEAAALLTATSSSGSSVTDSTWDVVSGGSIPLNVNDATTSSGTTTNTSYLYGNLLFGGTAPVEQITTTSSGSTVRYLVANQTGVQGVYSSTGALQELALYSLYGVQTIMSGAKVTPFGYQGSYTDLTGLIYLINRYYDPTTDEFLSIDPDVALTDQPYLYTGDDPLNLNDPLGDLALAAPGGIVRPTPAPKPAPVQTTLKKVVTVPITTSKTKVLMSNPVVTVTLTTSVTVTGPTAAPVGIGISIPSGDVSVTPSGSSSPVSLGGVTGVTVTPNSSSIASTTTIGPDEMTTSITTTYDTTPENWSWFTATASAFATGAYGVYRAAKFLNGLCVSGSNWCFMVKTEG